MNKTPAHVKYVEEESSCGIEFSFFDTDEITPVTPISLSYSLVNRDGEVINNLENIPLTPAEKVVIKLSGQDLVLPENGESQRYLVIRGTYNSNQLEISDLHTQHEFTLKPIK